MDSIVQQPSRSAIALLALIVAALLLAGCIPPPAPVAKVQVSGRATAGPVCPVERVPPDPNCAPRAVGGATIVVTSAVGVEVARTQTAPDGSFGFTLPEGDYTLVPQPMSGLLGTAPPIPFSARLGVPVAPLDVEYDTGIR